MLILGIECTAHTFGIGLIDFDKKKTLFNEKNVFKSKNEGMDLRKLTTFHLNNFEEILLKLKTFLKNKKIKFNQIELIGFSRGPGIGNSLKFASLVAKTLSKKYNIKIIGVNHIISHFEVGRWLSNFKDPIFLNITGVNSQITLKNDNTNFYKIYGETLDIGIGNLFDSIARIFGLGFPGGPEIEKLAKKGKNFIEMPYSIKGMNVSYSGILTYVKNLYQKKKKNLEENKISQKEFDNFIYDVCYSFSEVSFSMLIEVLERAIYFTDKKEICVVGGVASSKTFTDKIKKLCKSRKLKYVKTPFEVCMDNGVMIAASSGNFKKYSQKNIKNLKINPYIRGDENFY